MGEPTGMNVFFLIAILYLTFSSSPASADRLDHAFRVKDKKFTSFFHRRFDEWFSKSEFSLKDKMSSQDKEIWNTFIESQHDFGLQMKNTLVRSFEYVVRIDDFTNENSKKKSSLRFLNFQKSSVLDRKIRSFIKEKASRFASSLKTDEILGLSWSSEKTSSLLVYYSDLSLAQNKDLMKSYSKEFLSGPGLLEISLDSKNEKTLYRFGVESKFHCPGVREILQRNQKIISNEIKTEYCDISDWQPESLGALTEKVVVSFYKGMNLKVSAIGLSKGNREVELIWP